MKTRSFSGHASTAEVDVHTSNGAVRGMTVEVGQAAAIDRSDSGVERHSGDSCGSNRCNPQSPLDPLPQVCGRCDRYDSVLSLGCHQLDSRSN